ncbi:MAG TPA: ATP-binding protein [Geomonas sp.]|nr:ATP-binding protein [Geomonas sp.]
MKNVVRRYDLPLALAAVIAVTLCAFIYIVNTNDAVRAEARARFFEQYNRQQYLVAQLTAHSLDELFANFDRNLDLAASLFQERKLDQEGVASVRPILGKIFGSLSGTPVIDLVVFDPEGTAVAIEPNDPFTVGRSYAWREYYRWLRSEKKPGRMYVSPFMRLAGGRNRGVKEIIVAKGIYGTDWKFRGVVACTVDFQLLARNYILSVRIGKHGQAWLVDGSTRHILVDPNGRIEGRTIEEAAKEKWPQLYGLMCRAARGEAGSGWYDFEDPEDPDRTVRKLVSYHPVRLENRIWAVGVATPEREVSALLASFLQRQEYISTMLLFTITAGAALLLAVLFNWNRSLSAQVALHTRALGDAHERLQATFDELLVTQKVAAVGQLVLGLVHEIRNPLSAIQMNLQMIRKKIAPSGILSENFSIADGEIQRLNRLLKDMLDFARPRPLRLQQMAAPAMVRRLLQLVAPRLAGSCIESREDVDPALVLVCDPEQIHQVLLNLVLNACEAMEQGGGERVLTISAHAAGAQARFIVSDTGGGIPPEQAARLFDPFYTTKAAGGGLGLSTVHTIVTSHKGSVSVLSEPGQGSSFTVTLPLAGPLDLEVLRENDSDRG